MGLAKNLGHFDQCTVTILLLAVTTSLCSASVSMATDATFLAIPALGRTSQLGFLYDERTDTFRPISVFSRTIPTEVVIETQSRDVATVAQHVSNTYDEKLQLLEIELNAALNILTGNTKVRGVSSILKQENENSLVQQGTLLRTYHTADESLQVFYDDLRPFYNKHLLQHKDATHVVSGISWGSRISVTLQAAVSVAEVIDSEDWSDVIYNEFQKLKRDGSLTSEKVRKPVNFTIDVKSDIPLSGPAPTTIKDVEILLNQMPQLINDTIGGNGVPLEFTLTPLSELRSHLDVQTIINNPVHKIKESTLRRLVNTFDDILNSEQRLNDLYQKTYFQLNCLQPETRDEIADLRTGFLKYKKRLAVSVKETLVDVRSGSKPTSALTEIAEEFKQSNFSSRRIRNKIRDEFNNVIEKVEFCEMIQTLYSEIEYFGSRHQNLIPRISENSQRPIYIFFVKTEFKNSNPLKYTDDMNTFLATLYTAPLNKLFIVDCDGGNVLCTHLNQTEIHEYKNGRLTSRDLGGHHDEEEERNLEKRLIELEKNVTVLHNLTAYLLKQHTDEEPTDNCKSSPCQNNGLCHSGVNSFNCTCTSGFTGPTCNENVNECESAQNSCDNGGSCIYEFGGFVCVCPLPFVGLKCQEMLDPCRNMTCQNGASCVASSNYLDFACNCADGFNGTFCELNIDDCSMSESCQNGGRCVDGVNSYSCICPDAFAGTHCEEKNKCRYPGTCASPIIDAGNCHRCRDGFVKDPEDDTRCKYANENAVLIISSEKEIIKMSLDGQNTTQMIQSKELARGTDYNFQTNTIFWSTMSDKNIYTAPINTESGKTSILYNASSDVYGTAVDWVHHHLYWVDGGRKEICVSNFDGTMQKVLFNDGLSKPTSIALNPLIGWMYWSDHINNRIERAGLDGSRREVILSTNIKTPFGLAVDFIDSRLYWTQGQNPSSMWSSNLDGSDPKLVLTANPSIFSSSTFWKIATHDKYVYLIDFFSKTIYKVNKCDGQDLKMIYKSGSNLREIKIFDETLQPKGENVCSTRTEQCSHFCFPVPVSSSGNGSVSMTTCACPDGLSLSADQLSCV